jgi:glutaminyl-tRNA synthetase
VVDLALFEHALREDLDKRSPRVMGVLRPLKLTVESLPADAIDQLDAPYWPADAGKDGARKLPFTRELLIEQSDFEESPPKDFHRLAPGRTVRLRHAFIVTCTGVVKDAAGNLVEVKCTHDPASRGGAAQAGQKVEGTIHWVSAPHSIAAEVRLYDRLFSKEVPGVGGDFQADLNPASLEVLQARVEPSLAQARPGEHYQLERHGYFVIDPDSKPGALVFGRTVTLKDSWAKAVKAPGEARPARSKPAKQQPAAAAQELSSAASALQEKLGVGADEARTLDAEPALRALVEEAMAAGAPGKEAAALVCNDLLGELRARKLAAPVFGGAALAELLALIKSGALSSRMAKEVLGEMLAGEGSPRAIVEKRGLTVISDSSALEAVVTKVIDANPELVARVKAGNANVIGALLGMAMRESGGRASPKTLRELLEKSLR